MTTDVHPLVGWLAIALLVGCFDVANKRSLTSYAQAHRKVALLGGTITTMHLAGLLPDRVDPFHYAAGWLGRK